MGGLEPSGSPWREKKRKPNVFIAALKKKPRRAAFFFNKKETLLLKWALSQGKVVPEEANRAIAAFFKNLQDFAKF